MNDPENIDFVGEFKALASSLEASEIVIPSELPRVRRNSFLYGLHIMDGEDIRQGLLHAYDEAVGGEDLSNFDEIDYDLFSYTVASQMAEYVTTTMQPKAKVGPLLAVQGTAVCVTPTDSQKRQGLFFQLRAGETIFGTLSGGAVGNYFSQAASGMECIEEPEDILTLPQVFGGLACLECVHVVRDNAAESNVIRNLQEVHVPLKEPGVRFAVAYPIV